MQTNLPKLVDTYKNVCGLQNPWTGAPNVAAYGADAATYHSYMLALHETLPVMDDFTKLRLQIVATMTENAAKYAAMYKAEQSAAAIVNPLTEYDYTETTTHTGTDTDTISGTETKTRTGSIADSGTDSTANGGTATDSTKTYDSDTYKEIAKTVTSATGSVTHGKTTTYNQVTDTTGFADRENEREYNTTTTKTVTGHKMTPGKLLSEYTEFVRRNNVFHEIINDVLRAISCIVYIPVVPENNEEE